MLHTRFPGKGIPVQTTKMQQSLSVPCVYLMSSTQELPSQFFLDKGIPVQTDKIQQGTYLGDRARIRHLQWLTEVRGAGGNT